MDVGNRKRGALLGLAVGDALGTTLEFSTPEAPPLPELATGPVTDVIGQGPFELEAGQVTDDSQMAACLAASLAARGRLDTGDVAARYVAWVDHAFDIGNQTYASLSRVKAGATPEEAGHGVWVDNDRHPAGNGSLMRTVPVAVFFASDEDALIDASLADSGITHWDPRCQLACAGFNAAVAALIRGSSREQAVETAGLGVSRAAQRLADQFPDEAHHVSAAANALQDDLRAARDVAPGLYGDALHIHRHAGFVRVAFRLAFWHLVHTGAFDAALIDIVNRGGDADTNGAIAGALLGAAVGETGIPRRWRETVLNALADRPNHPLASEYHPRVLLSIA